MIEKGMSSVVVAPVAPAIGLVLFAITWSCCLLLLICFPRPARDLAVRPDIVKKYKIMVNTITYFISFLIC